MSRANRSQAARVRDAAPIFAALGDETRLRLVYRLCESGPLSIRDLSDGSGVTRQAITKHLHALSEAGLVRGSRTGRKHIWQLEHARLDRARQCIDDISRQWDVALDRLKAFVEE